MTESEDAFYRREIEANSTVRTDIDLNSLDYLTIPMDKFPSDSKGNMEMSKALDELNALKDKRILNLTKMSNTDLKLEYGRNHLDEMQAIGENYVQLSILIVTIAEILYEAGEYNDAARILEYGIATKTDINKNYMLLADCYNMLGSTRQLTELREQVPTMGLTLERNILSHIDDLIKSSSSTPSENFPTEN
ncbi:MAG: hypothetical protein II169_05355 [Lachnospiraceae bacterium]|nr:hypothetical protein [Lachnospiraceae bacterium]